MHKINERGEGEMKEKKITKKHIKMGSLFVVLNRKRVRKHSVCEAFAIKRSGVLLVQRSV